ncbi:MAG TPA: PTS sugar transporter subunit IIC [Longimicrobium sp.]|nr:PTS sugar transporter subunit IIC [Longimicrobium sp.]
MTSLLASFAVLALVGGVVALDGTSVGQVMLSRPLVAGTLGGLLVGAPAQGAMAGVVLEALHLAVLPVGAARYPEGGPAALVAGAFYAASDPGTDHGPGVYGGLLLVTVFALAWEWVGAASVEWMRRFNVRFAGVPRPEDADPAAVARRHGTAIALDYARGAGVTLGGALALWALLRAVPLDDFPEDWARWVVGASVAAGTASALRLFGRSHYPLFLGGAALAALLAWLR